MYCSPITPAMLCCRVFALATLIKKKYWEKKILSKKYWEKKILRKKNTEKKNTEKKNTEQKILRKKNTEKKNTEKENTEKENTEQKILSKYSVLVKFYGWEASIMSWLVDLLRLATLVIVCVFVYLEK